MFPNIQNPAGLVEHNGFGLVVSSVTIAEGTGNQHKSVIRLIRDNRADFEDFGRVRFENAPLQTAGGVQQREVAQLNEQQATLLMTYLRNSEQVRAFKKALVKAFYEMAQQLTKPAQAEMSRMEILQLAMQAEQERAALAAKVEQDAPKVEYVNTFVADEDLVTVRTIASGLNIGEAELRELLVAKKWIYRQTATRWSNKANGLVSVHRYSAFADKKPYFQAVMNHEAPRFKGEVMHTLKVTPAGAAAIARLVTGLRKARAIMSEVESA